MQTWSTLVLCESTGIKSLAKTNAQTVIIGASGSIGNQLYNDYKQLGKSIIGTYCGQQTQYCLHFNMLTDNIDKILRNLQEIHCIYLLAAVTNPNWIFNNQQLSQEINVTAIIKIIDYALQYGIKIIFLSSTMVFDGQKGNYNENSNVNPTTCYGRQKVEVEQYLLNHNSDNWCIVRTDSVITKRLQTNCPVEKTYQTLFNGNAQIASDNIFNLTNVRDISLVLSKLASDKYKGIFHAVNSQTIRRSQLAYWIQDNSIFSDRMSFREVSWENISYPEQRPRNTTLNNDKIVAELKIKFSPPKKAVLQKIASMDKYIISNKPWWS